MFVYNVGEQKLPVLYPVTPSSLRRNTAQHEREKTHTNSRLDCRSNQKKLKIVYYFYTFCPR